MPMRARTASRSTLGEVTSWSPTMIRPEVGSSSRLTQRSRVDLPEPDGPMMQAVVPAGTSSEMPRRTFT